MADFHLWSRANLEKFAEEASAELLRKDETIAQLGVQLLRAQVKQELAEPVSPDTLPHANASPLDR